MITTLNLPICFRRQREEDSRIRAEQEEEYQAALEADRARVAEKKRIEEEKRLKAERETQREQDLQKCLQELERKKEQAREKTGESAKKMVCGGRRIIIGLGWVMKHICSMGNVQCCSLKVTEHEGP